MRKRFNLTNFYKSALTSDIHAWSPNDVNKYSFTVADVVQAPVYVVIEWNNEQDRDVILVHRNDGNTMYYYNYNRTNPSASHNSWDVIQLNNVAEYFNYIFKNLEDFWSIKKKTGLYITINWWTLNFNYYANLNWDPNWPDGWVINIPDTDITLPDNTDNIIYLDLEDNIIKRNDEIDAENILVLADVITSWWQIQQIIDRRWYPIIRWPKWPAGAGMNWKWIYDNDTQYDINDAVEYNWNSYICITPVKWEDPTNTDYWNLIAKQWADWTWSWDMQKSTYDTDNDWIVDNSAQLNWQDPSYYLDRTNHTWTQDISTINNLQSELDSKANLSWGNDFTGDQTVDWKVWIWTTNPWSKLTIWWVAWTDWIEFPDWTIQTTAWWWGGWGWTITTLDILEVAGTQTVGVVSSYRTPQAWTLAKFSAYLETAPSGSDFTVDIKINWTTQATATITAGTTSWTTTTFTNTTLNEWDLITYEITQVGSNVAGADLTLWLNLS